MRRLAEAEHSALTAQAIEGKTKNRDPRLHVLLAEIYDEKGETAEEADELREYLKIVTDPRAQALVKQALAALEKGKDE